MWTILATVKPLIKDTPKEDKSPNKGQAQKSTLDLMFTLYRKSLLKEDNLSTKDKTAGPRRCPLLRGSTVSDSINLSLCHANLNRILEMHLVGKLRHAS